MKTSLFQTIFFGLFGFAALVGVFVFATHTGSKNDAATTIGTVTIWGTLPKANMQSILLASVQVNKLLKDVLYVEKSADTLPVELASAIATGNPPDLVLASQEELLPLTKLIVPVPLTTLSVPTFTTTFVQEGGLFAAPAGAGYYGVPFLVDPLVLFSNREILSSSGIAKPPATWEALTGLVPNIALLTPTKQITRGLIALGTYENVNNARAILSSLFQQTRVPISVYTNNSLRANLSGPLDGGTTSGKAVLNFYTQFADPSKVSYTWNASLPNSRQAFQNGDLTLYLGFASEARELTKGNPNLNFTVSPLPQPATNKSKSAYGLVYAFMTPRGAQNPTGALQAISFLTSSAIQGTAASTVGIAPAILSELATVPADPVAAVAYAEALYTKGWLSPAPADTDTVFSSMISSVISGRLAPDSALSSSENALTVLLQK